MNLLITLGHNSSAIIVDNDGNILCGYEEERLTRIKGDKNFPKESIVKCLEMYEPSKDDVNKIFISHWYDDFDFYKNKNSYFYNTHRYNYDFMNELIEKYNFEIVTLSPKFTHHDAHAYSAIAFRNKQEPCHVVVADGFGNNEEVISIYYYDGKSVIPFKKVIGYETSLGLMYQYATAYVGMKENQDEYKFLAFEPKIDTILNKTQIDVLQDLLENKVKLNIEKDYKYDNSYINIEKLQNVRKEWYRNFDMICDTFSITDVSQKRIIIGYSVQYIIENILTLSLHNIKNVVLVGGIFYNVKLNNAIMKTVDEICVMPLAGDQGAALGLAYYNNIPIKINDLYFGKRIFTKYEDITKNVYLVKKEEELINSIFYGIRNDDIIQLYIGNMEFGPRALCHTSTICRPTKENTEIINLLNNRVNEMPMAPVMTDKGYEYFFNDEQRKKIYKSQEHMIITLDYKNEIVENEFEKYEGVMHKYPLQNLYSGRPQVIYDHNNFMYKALERISTELNINCLINTSWNYHGKPILYSIEDLQNDLTLQLKNKHGITKNIYCIIANI